MFSFQYLEPGIVAFFGLLFIVFFCTVICTSFYSISYFIIVAFFSLYIFWDILAYFLHEDYFKLFYTIFISRNISAALAWVCILFQIHHLHQISGLQTKFYVAIYVFMHLCIIISTLLYLPFLYINHCSPPFVYIFLWWMWWGCDRGIFAAIVYGLMNDQSSIHVLSHQYPRVKRPY